jgi:hypothetical protein
VDINKASESIKENITVIHRESSLLWTETA